MEQRKLYHNLLASLVVLVATQLQVQAADLPRLVVCITVDQLRGDYLLELEPLMGQEGFRRIYQTGKVYPQVSFPITSMNREAAIASIFTGTYPDTHGIEGKEVYARKVARLISLYQDNSVQGVYTRESYSPRALSASTLGDRLKEASSGASLVYSIAPSAAEAISAGGHLADGVYWLDGKTCSWATSNYYEPMLRGVEQYNKSTDGPNRRVVAGSMQWTPLRSYRTPSVQYSDWGRKFSYHYQGYQTEEYKQSALVNEEVTALALRLLEESGLDKTKSPSLLALTYTAQPMPEREELSAETVDTYVRLDAELSRLLSSLDRKVGLNNCLIALTGTGYNVYDSKTRLRRAQKYSKAFNLQRSMALVNMYLSALHGAGDWIEHTEVGRVYLSRRLAEQRKIPLAQLEREVVSFLSEMEGVDYAITGEKLLLREGLSVQEQRLRNGLNSRYMADVYYQLLPTWSVEDRGGQLSSVASASLASPFVLMGAGIDQHFDYPVCEVKDIVRAICYVLRIRPPNA